MKNLILLAVLSACLLLGGCVSLLERSYSVVEPYADRYWDSAAEDTLKAENYQDLVNSLLMQVEQRAEECVIRGYGEAAGYGQARSASWEVRRETIPGSYLLENMTFDYEPSDGYSTFTFRMSYREDAEDIEAMMSLSDCQSLVDLLRLSVREDHHRLTARFIRDMRREEVRAAVEALWQELCRGEKEDVPAPLPEDAGDTAYGRELLGSLSRKAGHWARVLGESLVLMAEDCGLHSAGLVRGRKKSLQRCLELFREYVEREHIDRSDYTVATGYGYDHAEYAAFNEQAAALLRDLGHTWERMGDFHISVTIGVHTGPHPIGIGLLRRA